MMNISKALEIALHDNPGMKMINGIEYDDIFGFNLIPENLPKGDLYANGCLYVVYKESSKSEWLSSDEIIKKWGWPPIRSFPHSDSI